MDQEQLSGLEQLQSHLPEIRQRMGESFDAMAFGIWKYSGLEDRFGLDVAQFIFSLVINHCFSQVTLEPLIITPRSLQTA